MEAAALALQTSNKDSGKSDPPCWPAIARTATTHSQYHRRRSPADIDTIATNYIGGCGMAKYALGGNRWERWSHWQATGMNW